MTDWLSRVRNEFPILSQKVGEKDLVYFDNAATTQKPRAVIDAVCRFYLEDCSNIHRGVHTLSERATRDYEDARKTIQHFLNAKSFQEIIFVRGATEGINLVAQTFGRKQIQAGDEILVTEMEHHSNIVPWQMLCEERGAHLRVLKMNDRGEVSLDDYASLLSPRTKLVSFVHISNALGTINPVKEMVRLAREKGIPTLIDGAQAVAHLKVDVQDLGCDFYVFSGHKIYGPTGVGVLYGRKELLEKMPPYQGGGDMIRSVRFEKTIYNELPYKFEAGTPNISGVVGLAAAIQFVEDIGHSRIHAHEAELLEHAQTSLLKLPWIRLIGTAREKAAVVSFVVEDIHPHDVGTLLDEEGIAIRTGHHCAEPAVEHFGVAATCRASFALYNTREEIDRFVKALHRVKEVFG